MLGRKLPYDSLPQLRQSLLNVEDRRRVVDLMNQKKIASGEGDEHDSPGVQQQSATQEQRRADVSDPKPRRNRSNHDSDDEEKELSDYERTQTGARASQLVFFELMQRERVLPLSPDPHLGVVAVLQPTIEIRERLTMEDVGLVDDARLRVARLSHPG